MESKKSKIANKVSLSIPDDILTAVKLLADYEDRTLSNMVTVLLKEALKTRSTPLITEVEWVKRNIQSLERPDAALVSVPRVFNLPDFIEKYHALPAWDINNETILEKAMKDWVKERYAENEVVQPVLTKSFFTVIKGDEERIGVEVPLNSKFR
jgi:hypothetical protein